MGTGRYRHRYRRPRGRVGSRRVLVEEHPDLARVGTKLGSGQHDARTGPAAGTGQAPERGTEADGRHRKPLLRLDKGEVV